MHVVSLGFPGQDCATVPTKLPAAPIVRGALTETRRMTDRPVEPLLLVLMLLLVERHLPSTIIYGFGLPRIEYIQLGYAQPALE